MPMSACVSVDVTNTYCMWKINNNYVSGYTLSITVAIEINIKYSLHCSCTQWI